MSAEAIRKYVEDHRQDIVNVLSDLVDIESVTCNESAAVERVRQEMESMGYDEVRVDSFGNVIGRIGSGPKILVFDAHLDVVDAEGQEWATPPFKAVIKDGVMYGRGTVDDKGPFVCTLFAGKGIKELGLGSEYTVYVIGSIVEEDCEGLALGACLEGMGIEPDHVVIAESSELEICRGHRGRAQVRAVFRGTPVHASRHSEGVNPLELASDFIQGVKKLDAGFSSVEPLGKADVVAVDLRCLSNSLSTTPAEAHVYLDRRTNTADTRESILEELRAVSGAEKGELEYVEWEATGYNGKKLKAEEFFPAWAVDESHPLIQAGVQAFRDYKKREPVVTTWGFSTNGNYTMGRKGYPTIGFGPGEMALCHGPDEHIYINDLLEATGFYMSLVNTLNKS